MRPWARPIAVGAVIAAGAALAIACGSFGSSGSAPKPIADARADTGEGEPPEERVLAFPCGDTKCFAGEQACCQIGPAFSCFSIDAGGCPYSVPTDGGAATDAAPSGPPLLCTSYLNCAQGEQCCYRVDLGSSCQNNCPNGSDSLCTLGSDRCDSYTDCVTLSNPPQKGIGACKYNGGNTSGGTSGGTSGWH